MKKLMTLVMLAMTALTTSAQIEDGNWYITPKAGVSVADMTGRLFYADKAEGTYDCTLRPITSFAIGIDMEYAMADQLALGFGLNYARKGSKTDDGMFRVQMDYVNIPLTLNFYPIRNAGLALKAGIQVGFAARKRLKMDGVEYNADYVRQLWMTHFGRIVPVYVESELSRQFNKVDFAIPLAVSYEFKNVVLEARYNLGLTNVMKDDPEASKHKTWVFTLGYKFDLGD